MISKTKNTCSGRCCFNNLGTILGDLLHFPFVADTKTSSAGKDEKQKDNLVLFIIINLI